MDSMCRSENCHDCPERLVCRCLNITEDALVTAITSGELTSLHDLRRHTGAGDGCTCCHETLKAYLARYSLEVVCG